MKSSARGGAGPAALLLALLLAAIAWVYVLNRTRVVFAADSEFGGVRVTERADGLRRLYIGAGRAVQSAIYPGRPEHLEHAYTRVAMVAPALAPDSARILFVGLGGGAMPMFTRHALPGATIDVAEIDPVVVEAAHEWFAFRSDDRMRVHTGDGRAFIEQASPGTWDVIVLDAFSDDEIALALATREFLVAVHESLADDGVVASNLWTSNPLHAEMVATYLDVFENVVLIDVPRRGGSRSFLPCRPEARLTAVQSSPRRDGSTALSSGRDSNPASTWSRSCATGTARPRRQQTSAYSATAM